MLHSHNNFVRIKANLEEGGDKMFKSAFMNGFARSIDLGTIISDNINAKLLSKSDKEVISEDWKVVGRDIKLAMEAYNNGKTTTSK